MANTNPRCGAKLLGVAQVARFPPVKDARCLAEDRYGRAAAPLLVSGDAFFLVPCGGDIVPETKPETAQFLHGGITERGRECGSLLTWDIVRPALKSHRQIGFQWKQNGL